METKKYDYMNKFETERREGEKAGEKKRKGKGRKVLYMNGK